MKQYVEMLLKSRLVVPILLAALIGVATGFIAVGFIHAIDFIEYISFSSGKSFFHFLGKYYVILIPILGGLLVGPLVAFFAPEARGHGVPEVLKAIALHGGKIRPVVVVVKAVASALSIGTGFSVGREGPIVQVGASLGSSMGQFFKFSELRLKNLIACGAAAGIAAVFNAPIAGVMFASEVILRDFGARALSTVVVASVASSIISRIFLGEAPAFVSPAYTLESPLEIFLYVLLGLLCAIMAVLFIVVLAKTETVWDKWQCPQWFKPAVGGLFIGIIGLFFPQIFGSGLSTIESALHGHLELQLLIMLVFVKIIATSLSLGAGSSGGVFAPALFIGAVLGGAFGFMANHFFPTFTAPPGAYALVGMASVFSGVAHAPVTAVLIVFEMTGDYKIILPIMVSVVLSTVLSQLMHKESIYTDKLKQRGVDLDFLQEARVLGAIQVKDIMNKKFEIIPMSLSGKKLMEKISKAKNKSLFVADQKGILTGSILPEKVQDILLEESFEAIVAADIAEPILESCYPEEPLSEASRLMMTQGIETVPVLDPMDETKVVGVIRSENIFQAITEMTTKHSLLIDRIEEQKGTMHLQFSVTATSLVKGKQIRDLKLPKNVVFTSLKRAGKTIIPRGDTELKARDRIFAVIAKETQAQVEAWLKKQKLK